MFVALPPTLFISASLYANRFEHDWTWLAMAGLWMASISLVLWVAHKRYRHTHWKLDADGFSVRRGRLWQWETRVPTSRVQHLDIKRGPLERAHRLASLVLHTAGTRLNAVSISGLEDEDAERLRNYFSRQIDRQEDDDHADA
ncbi:MAG: PH domain-containing protein [Lysobacter sp.]|nr:PH domain-containing protein [Lysobacter sp.]